MSLPDQAAPPPAPRFRLFRRGAWETFATIVIAAGVLMLLQPFSITLYGWSFATTLTGVVMFTIVSKFPD